MKINILILIVGFVLPVFIFGQGEANNWYFGENAGITFNIDGSINALTDGQLNTFEGNATISSPTGDLLFYTDGVTVYDRNHNIMPNGTGLLGNISSTQSAIIVPQPENPNLYYIFTVAPDVGIGLNYSIVDISLNGGNGAVTAAKNVNLLSDCSEKVAAITKDCAANSIWIVTIGKETPTSPSRPHNTYHAFEITSSGIMTPSVKSTFPSLNFPLGAVISGYLKLSPDGTKMASANLSGGLYIYDFDSQTGIVTNQRQININAATDIYAYGIEFSPNSQYLYAHGSNNLQAINGHTSSLYQFDTQTALPTITDSQIVLDNSRNLYRGALQLGPDGRIYRALSVNYFSGTPYLGVIANPDIGGVGATYQHNANVLGGRNARQGLPPFVQSFFNTVYLIPQNTGTPVPSFAICAGDPLTLQTQFIPGASYEWMNGSGTIVSDTDLDDHILNITAATTADAGDFIVTITRPNAAACPIIGTLEVIVNSLPVTNVASLFVCDTDGDTMDGFTVIDLTQTEDNTIDYTFYETMADRTAGTNPITNVTNYTTISSSQTLYYNAESALTGCFNAAELQIEVGPIAPFTLDFSYFICVGNPTVNIIGPAGYDSYSWVRISDLTVVSTDQDATIDQVGNYRLVTGTNHSPINGVIESCTTEAIFEVLQSNLSVADLAPNGETVTNGTFTICQNQPLILETTYIPGAIYDWTLNGVALASSGNSYEITATAIADAGDYEVTVTDPAAASCPVNAAMTVVIDTTVTNSILEMQVCDSDLDDTNDGFTAIDLTQSADPAFTYTYFETAANRDAAINSIPDPTNYRNDNYAYSPTIYFNTVSTSGCDGIGELQITVNAVPSLLVERNHWLCPENTTVSVAAPNGYDTYQWYRLETTGRLLYASTQTAQFTDVGNFVLEASMDFTQNGETISCSSSAEVEVLSSALSIADLEANGTQPTNGSFTVCEGQLLELQTAAILGATYSWEKDGIPIANPSDHILLVNATSFADAGNYLVTVTGTGPLTCPVRGTINIVVDPLLVLTNDTILSCDTDTDNPTDGLTTLDLTQIANDPNVTYSYYESEADRDVNSVILNPESYRNSTPFNQTIYIKTTNAQGCENLGEIQLEIRTAPEFVLDEIYGICASDTDLIIEGPVGFNSYQWFSIDGSTQQLISEQQNFAVFQIGEFMLEATIEYTNNGQTVSCVGSAFFSVQQSEAATIDDIVIEGNTIDNSVQVLVSGNGDYEFSIDGSTYQEANFFDNIPSGETRVYVNDKNGCGITEQIIDITLNMDFFGFPKFFTPNADGTNDFWQYMPPPVDEIALKSIYIYNRYGNLLAQIDPNSSGWDGQLNGTPLPSTDYWFMALTNNQEMIRGHFSLKR